MWLLDLHVEMIYPGIKSKHKWSVGVYGWKTFQKHVDGHSYPLYVLSFLHRIADMGLFALNCISCLGCISASQTPS